MRKGKKLSEKKLNNLIEIIINEKLVPLNIIQDAIEQAQTERTTPVAILLRQGHITQRTLHESLAKTYKTRYVELSEMTIDPSLSQTIKPELAKKHGIIPIKAIGDNKKLIVAVPLPKMGDLPLMDRIRQETGFVNVSFQLAMESQIAQALKDLYRADAELEEIARNEFKSASELGSSNIENLTEEEEITDESDVQRYVRLALEQAVSDGASDIIFESFEHGLQLRYRIDGLWYHRSSAPKGMSEEILSVIKIQANLDISVKKRAQDGRMSIIHNNTKIDFRVNILPIQDGENVTMRIIDNSQANLDLEDLGFNPHNLERFKYAIEKPQGLIVVTGPTGSGKSVTLYAGLNKIANTHVNTYTIEDPIEYRIENVKQSQIDVKAGWTYPEAIRAFMRSAPDNILVGEIRDLETAQMALQAGMTGHLVLSTLHTNSAAEAAARLMDMGAEPDIVSMTLTAIVAQRLVRKLCNRCKQADNPDPDDLLRVNFPWKQGTPLPKLYKAKEGGCKECKGLGFKGRTAAHEVLLVDHNIRELIIKKASAKEIEDKAIENGMHKMLDDGFEKVLNGVTTINEVFRSIQSM